MYISNAIDFTQKVSVTGVVVAIGHSAAEAALIDKAIEAGARDHSLEKRQSQKRGATADSFSRPKITKNGSYQASFNLIDRVVANKICQKQGQIDRRHLVYPDQNRQPGI